MQRTPSRRVLLGAALALSAVAAVPPAAAEHGRGERNYRVTITNATLGQPVTPSVIAVHHERFRLFEIGPTPAPAEPGYDRFFALATLAETGSPTALQEHLAQTRGVADAQVLATDRTPPVLLPGESNSLVVSAPRWADRLSAVAMLAASNDAFYAARGVPLPRRFGELVEVHASAYDAGSEANAETADTAAALGATDDDPVTGAGIDENGEGHIHVHAGVHGVGGPDGLDPAAHDWRNPVLVLTIERVR